MIFSKNSSSTEPVLCRICSFRKLQFVNDYFFFNVHASISYQRTGQTNHFSMMYRTNRFKFLSDKKSWESCSNLFNSWYYFLTRNQFLINHAFQVVELCNLANILSIEGYFQYFFKLNLWLFSVNWSSNLEVVCNTYFYQGKIKCTLFQIAEKLPNGLFK